LTLPKGGTGLGSVGEHPNRNSPHLGMITSKVV
jgi:hypothetical protein